MQFDSGGQPLFPESLPGSGGAAGSGCVPGGDVLPDGIWFGFVEATNATDLTFDLACMWVGAAAEREAAADGEEVTQDYYLENRNPRTFVVPISETSRVWDAPLGQAALAETSLEAWLGADCQVNPQPWCPSVWLYVNDGQVTSIVKQFRP